MENVDFDRFTGAATPVNIPEDIFDGVLNDGSDYNHNLVDKNFISYINDDNVTDCFNTSAFNTQACSYEAQVGNSFPQTQPMIPDVYSGYGVASPATTANTFDDLLTVPKGKKRDKTEKCMSKNAIAARQNRYKKKCEQENKVKLLEDTMLENKNLKESLTQVEIKNKELTERLNYYEAVIANIPEVLELVKHIQGGGAQVNIGGSQLPQILPAIDAGVCLHIKGRNITLEFCPACASKQQIKMENNT